MNSRDNTEYAQHLETLQGRFSAALTASGHDAALCIRGRFYQRFVMTKAIHSAPRPGFPSGRRWTPRPIVSCM